MCGRFFVKEDTLQEIQKILRQLEERLGLNGAYEKGMLKAGDVYPMESAPIISGKDGQIEVTSKRWGFPGFGRTNMRSSGLIINARAETALAKKTFRDSVLQRRAVIPAAGFYEWNRNKEKITFTPKDSGENRPGTLYMAGFYKKVEGEDRFVILTTAANASMKDVHDRMPLILEPEEVEDWLWHGEKLETFLHKIPPQLQKEAGYEQQELHLD